MSYSETSDIARAVFPHPAVFQLAREHFQEAVHEIADAYKHDGLDVGMDRLRDLCTAFSCLALTQIKCMHGEEVLMGVLELAQDASEFVIEEEK